MGLLSDLAVNLLCGPPAPAPLPPFDPAKGLAAARPGFLFGAATSAHQVEGGLVNDWTSWETGRYADGRPHVVDGARSTVACDSWNRFGDDLDCLRTLGANAYRLGVEWARLCPAEGAWDEAAAARYHDMLAGLAAAGIAPVVTLWHFTLPPWVAARGGWEWPGAIAAFEDFAGRCARAFGDVVDLWCTLNEPNVFAMKGYAMGEWPPGLHDLARAAAVQAALLRAHAAAARALRTHDTTDADGDGHATRIGLAHHLRVFEPASRSPLDAFLARTSAAFFNDTFPEAIAAGRVRVSVPGTFRVDEPCDGLAGSLDWFGVNYYSRDHVGFDVRHPLSPKLSVPAGRVRNDLGWDVYPQGLHRLLVDAHRRWGWPLVVTENGIADRTGTRRTAFLHDHLAAVAQALSDGADVRGYLHWSLLDNFEWAEGWTGRFGLFSVDFEPGADRARRATPAVEAFRAVADAHAFTPANARPPRPF